MAGSRPSRGRGPGAAAGDPSWTDGTIWMGRCWVNVVNPSSGNKGQSDKYKSGESDTKSIMALMGTLARYSPKRSDAEEASGEEAEYEIVDLELTQGSEVTIFIPAEGPIFGFRRKCDRTVYSLNTRHVKSPIIATSGQKIHFRAPPALG